MLAAGCGGSDDKDGGDSDFAKQSGDKIAADAKADMKDLDEVKFSGEITSEGDTVTLDVQASSAGDCTGSIGIGGGTAEILAKDGTNWFKPDEAFWRANAADSADAIIAAVGDKWVLDTDVELRAVLRPRRLLRQPVQGRRGRTASTRPPAPTRSTAQEVVKVEQTDDEGTSVGYVLIDGDHYLLKLERTEGDEPGHLEFSDFDEEFDVTAPADDEVIDLSTVQ